MPLKTNWNPRLLALNGTEDRLPPKPLITVPSVETSDQATELVEDSGDSQIGVVPVAEAPRLVQPTFASTDDVFENEAIDDIQTASVLFGVHLASYRKVEEAREGWRILQRENPDELGLLEPRIETVNLAEKGVFMRLIGGGFASQEKANELCAQLKLKGLYCSVAGFKRRSLVVVSSWLICRRNFKSFFCEQSPSILAHPFITDGE